MTTLTPNPLDASGAGDTDGKGVIGWQPIETAPTDYTEIIGMDASGRIARTWFFAPSSTTSDWLAVGGGRRKWHPVYWQHINDPRKAHQ